MLIKTCEEWNEYDAENVCLLEVNSVQALELVSTVDARNTSMTEIVGNPFRSEPKSIALGFARKRIFFKAAK